MNMYMFSQAVLLKHKASYCKTIKGKEEDKFSIEVVIKSNHQLEQRLLTDLENDIKRINTPMNYKLDEEKKGRKKEDD